jgi:threonine-phosphate decarboxylase
MIKGHGDDAYRYEDIRSDFSSNICDHEDHQDLMAHLASHPELISHYPEPEAWSLEKMIAKHLGIKPEQVIVTNGATEAIYLIAQTFPFEYTILGPTFSEYKDACNMFYSEPELTSVWLCNPNNPNGHVYSKSELRMFARNFNLVVVDQSYEYSTLQPMLSAKEAVKMNNVIQIHSMTKAYGVPGLRLGFITAREPFTEKLRQNLRPWSVNALAIEAGKFLLENKKPCKPDLNETLQLYKSLRALKGVSVESTSTNFMLCKLSKRSAAELKDYLVREHRMLIRDASNFNGLTARHFRVASQTPEENDALVAAINQFLANG